MKVIVISLVTALCLDLSLAAVPDAPAWFCILFGFMSYLTCNNIVEFIFAD